MDELYRRLGVLEGKVEKMEETVHELIGATGTTNTLIKYVILPLIVILGGLVGIKLVLPGA